MMPVSFSEAASLHPELARQVLAKLQHEKRDVKADDIAWFLVQCHDDPDQPLDEGGCADLMLTGRLPCRHGVCGFAGSHFGCFCQEDRVACGALGQ